MRESRVTAIYLGIKMFTFQIQRWHRRQLMRDLLFLQCQSFLQYRLDIQ